MSGRGASSRSGSGFGRGIGRGGERSSGTPQRFSPGRGGGGRGRGDSGGGGRGRGEVQGGRGGFGRGGVGRGGNTGGSENINQVLTNILPASLSPGFQFFVYGVEAKDKNDNNIEQRGRRADLFNKGFWDGLFADMSKEAKQDLKRVVQFEGSFFFSARAIPGLEKSNLPYELVKGNDSQGDTMSVVNVLHYKAPLELQPASVSSVTKGLQQLAIDPTRCGDCTKTFTSKEASLQHCKETGHSPAYIESLTDAIPAPLELFTAFANVALLRAMGERLLRWGNEFYDKDAPIPAKDRNGNDLGVTIFEAISLSFGVLKIDDGKPRLALTCDLRAKVIRNKSVLDMMYEDRRNPEADYTEQEKSACKRKWIGEIVIYKHDKKCYTVLDLDFNHSAASLPVPDKGVSHQEYFKQKGIKLEYPFEKPMIVVEGRQKRKIFLPPELVSGNELDPKVREMLPLVASFKPETRNKAIEKIKTFLVPGTQTSTGGTLLPSVGIILEQKRSMAKATVLSCPELMAAGVKIPQRNAENWAPLLSKASFNIDPKVATEMNVVIFCHKELVQGAPMVYESLRKLVNGFNTYYRFGPKHYALVPAGDNEMHWRAVEQYFSTKPPSNVFVLDFTKPRGALDTAYPVIKNILTTNGYLSQFVNFKTYNHTQPRDERRSSMILQGVARQILQKAGARIWWVDIPKSLPLPAVFVGVDVFHAPVVYDPKTKTKGRKSSVAAVIVEVIRDHQSTTRMTCYSKTYRRVGGQEYNLGSELTETMLEAFHELKITPKSVIVWRDGMPETAYAHALEEIKGIRDGLSAKLVGIASPTTRDIPLAYIVCQKRIATKFLTEDGRSGAPSGTLVTSLQSMDYQTFYINGRAPPYSTPKPVRFICMVRDNALKAVPLAQLTWGQCHAYPNWTGPIKVPCVTQKAHKLAELAGSFADGGEQINHKLFVNRDHYL